MRAAGTEKRRPRLWGIIVASSVAGMIVIAGGVAIWRGPGALPTSDGGATVCGTPPTGETGLFGVDFTDESGSAITIQSVHTARKTNVRVRSPLVFDNSHEGGIGASYVPDDDPETNRILKQSRPLHGFVLQPGHGMQILLDLAAIDRSVPGSLNSTTVVYTESGKPFTYEATSLNRYEVRPTSGAHC